MSAIKNYLIDLTCRVMEASHEIDPYERDWNSYEAFGETWESITTFDRSWGSLPTIICHFNECIDGIDKADLPNLYPATADLLPELNRYYEGYADMRYEKTTFAINSDYLNNFGSNADESTRIDYAEVKRLSQEWGVPLAVLITEQLTVIS